MYSLELTNYKVKNPFAQDGDRGKDLEAVEKLYERLSGKPEATVDGELEALQHVIQSLKDDLAEEVTYDVRNSLIEILFAPNQGLSAKDILDRDDLARKIRDSTEDSLLLEDAEYDKVKAAVESLRGYGRNDVILVRRVLAAPKVEVQAKAEK